MKTEAVVCDSIGDVVDTIDSVRQEMKDAQMATLHDRPPVSLKPDLRSLVDRNKHD